MASEVRWKVVETSSVTDESLESIVNDLQPATLSLAPGLADTLDAVGDAGAEHALVCGSGPTVAGIFWGSDAAGRAEAAARQLAGSHPGALSATPVLAAQ